MANTAIYEPGFLCAQGLFETMKACNNKIFFLERHLDRLLAALPAIKINLAYSKKHLIEIVNKTTAFNNYSYGYIRLTVWQGFKEAHISVIAREYRPYESAKYACGFKAIISSIRQNELSPLSSIKSSSRLHFLLAQSEAGEKGADEAILLNSKNKIAEGACTNIFFLKGNVLFTPNKESGCLPGITREIVLEIAKKENMEIREKEIDAAELFSAQEAFFTNSLIGIMPLAFLDNKMIGGAGAGRFTALFIKKYNQLLQKG